MMQATIDIPGPSPADNETVTTALETAAVFSLKGDGREAMRWLRRAAESAGEAGDDERALALSRRAADLHEELDAEGEPTRVASAPVMKRRGQSTTFRLSIAFGCLLIGLALGACGRDDDDTTGGTSGGNSGGESGAMSSGGGSAVGGTSGAVAGTAGDSANSGGSNDTSAAGQSAAGQSAGGSSGTGGRSAGGSSSTGGSGGGSAGNGFYLPCASQADCKAFGGGKICCSQGGMQFCTKQSACAGKILP